MAKSFTANTDYTVIDRAPLTLAEGDKVRLGRPDSAWPGWIWVTAPDGRGSYVPEEILTRKRGATATVAQAFAARDLSVSKGERVTSLREVKGWHWCRKSSGEEGWLPEYLLLPAT
jgi:uncharacterized protein YgiM (DUF1202 family)